MFSMLYYTTNVGETCNSETVGVAWADEASRLTCVHMHARVLLCSHIGVIFSVECERVCVCVCVCEAHHIK